jgi:hypothetical protein
VSNEVSDFGFGDVGSNFIIAAQSMSIFPLIKI